MLYFILPLYFSNLYFNIWPPFWALLLFSHVFTLNKSGEKYVLKKTNKQKKGLNLGWNNILLLYLSYSVLMFLLLFWNI